jgi:nicotinamidase-related amidase
VSANTALLVIDVQVGLVDSDGVQPAHKGEQMLEKINRLLVAARATGTPVIYIQHDGDAGGRLEAGSLGWAIHPAIAPAEGELVIRKRASDSFLETPLQRELAAQNITRLVITGMRTEMCVDTTSRRAISLGYDVTLVADAHATVDSEVLPAAQIIAHHNYTLDGFGTDEHEIAVRLASEVSF